MVAGMADIAQLASQVESGFPYANKRICYFERFADGHIEVAWLQHNGDREAFEARVDRARAQESTIFAAWPGEWKTALFIVDDLDAFVAQAL